MSENNTIVLENQYPIRQYEKKIAGALWILTTVIEIVSCAISVTPFFSRFFNHIGVDFSNVSYCFVCIFFAVALLKNNSKKLLKIGFIVNALYSFVCLIVLLYLIWGFGFEAWRLIRALSMLISTMCNACLLVCAFRRELFSKNIKFLIYIPIIDFINYIITNLISSYYTVASVGNVLNNLIKCVALIITCVVAFEIYETDNKKIVKYNQRSKFGVVFIVIGAVICGFWRLLTYGYVYKENRTLIVFLVGITVVIVGLIFTAPVFTCFNLKDFKIKNPTINNYIKTSYINIGAHILLLILTFGVWQLIWVYKTTKRFDNSADKAMTTVLLFLFVPFYYIYWFYKHGQYIDEQMQNKGNTALECLLFSIFIPIVAYIILQDRINTLSKGNFVSAEVDTVNIKSNSIPVDDIKQLKELLDIGAITNDEFEQKKRQLLNL